jgi:methylmalonyl-CoA mutase
MRRILQASGVEVIHLGHNRSVDEVVTAALQEDVQGIAVSSYQGGHIEYFKYMIDLLRTRGGEGIRVFGGGGGVIVPAEIRELEDYGVGAHLFARGRAADGPAGHDRRHARALDFRSVEDAPRDLAALASGDQRALARIITVPRIREWPIRSSRGRCTARRHGAARPCSA